MFNQSSYTELFTGSIHQTVAKKTMKQQSFAPEGFERYRNKTPKEIFLEEMDQIIPWPEMTEAIAPYYSVPKGAGRPPARLERMLRIHFLQNWFELSDPGVEEALYDSRALQGFVGIDLGKEPVPDETTILNFRHFMERHNLGDELFRLVNVYLAENGLKINRGWIVDASIISAPTSTKNKDKQRDPDMHQTRKGNQWYIGMKTHIGVGSKNKRVHSIVVTPAHCHDSQVIEDLLHGEETRVRGDSAYSGQGEAIKRRSPHARDFTQNKGSRYKGLDKNAHVVFTKCALVNLVIAKRTLLQYEQDECAQNRWNV